MQRYVHPRLALGVFSEYPLVGGLQQLCKPCEENTSVRHRWAVQSAKLCQTLS